MNSMVSEAGLEPARPFSQSLAPQASASANSATPTFVCQRGIIYQAMSSIARTFLYRLEKFLNNSALGEREHKHQNRNREYDCSNNCKPIKIALENT